MSTVLSTGKAYDWHQERLNRVRTAIGESELAIARLRGMKLRAQLDPPKPAIGHMPFNAKEQA